MWGRPSACSGAPSPAFRDLTKLQECLQHHPRHSRRCRPFPPKIVPRPLDRDNLVRSSDQCQRTAHLIDRAERIARAMHEERRRRELRKMRGPQIGVAARKRVEAARTLLVLAKNGLRPLVDLTFSTGYSGLREGVYPPSYLASLFHGVRGPDAMAGVRYEFAPRNNAAAGRLAQTEASIRQAELRAADAARGIAAAVVVALAGVRNAGLRLEKARESVTAFQSALDGEREKYRLGFGSLVNILTIEDRLTASLAVQVQARLDAAVELAHLRQATGTLVEPNTAAPRADGRAFVTLPVLGGPSQP